MNSQQFKILSIYLLKHVPFVCVALITIQESSIILGSDLKIAHTLTNISLLSYLTIMVFSHACNFCNLHRIAVSYIYLNSIFTDVDIWAPFPLFLTRNVMVVVGVLILFSAFYSCFKAPKIDKTPKICCQ